jgi:hypothetical protein
MHNGPNYVQLLTSISQQLHLHYSLPINHLFNCTQILFPSPLLSPLNHYLSICISQLSCLISISTQYPLHDPSDCELSLPNLSYILTPLVHFSTNHNILQHSNLNLPIFFFSLLPTSKYLFLINTYYFHSFPVFILFSYLFMLFYLYG